MKTFQRRSRLSSLEIKPLSQNLVGHTEGKTEEHKMWRRRGRSYTQILTKEMFKANK